MGFYENVHTLLGFRTCGGAASSAPTKSCNVPPPAGSEGLDPIDATGLPAADASSDKAAPVARVLHDCCCYGGGLGLCTESLGSESCDGALEPEEVAAFGASTSVNGEAEVYNGEERTWGCSRREAKREFPPPLRWMAGADGQRTAFLRAERSGRRLVLKEVRIDRPGLFFISRERGRLQLHLIKEEVEKGEEEEEEEQDMEVEEEAPVPSEAEEAPSSSSSSAEAANEEAEWELSAEERRDRRSGEWRRRCQETLSSSREAALWWNHHRSFMTTA